MSSSLDKLIPLLDGTNYRDWAVLMQSYLQMQELWDVVGREHYSPNVPTPTRRTTGTGDQRTTTEVPPTAEAMEAYRTAAAKWSAADDRAMGAITLHLAPQLQHYCAVTARATWGNLQTAFGRTSMSAVYADFKQVLNTKLSGGNPVPELELMATLFGRLQSNDLRIPNPLQGLMLLAAMPSKWDSVAQLFMQRTDLRNALTFELPSHRNTNALIDQSITAHIVF